MPTVVGHDDFSLSRVPADARYGWITMAVQRFGMLSALAGFFMAVSLGLGMTFWNAMLAITLGSVLLEAVTVFVGIAGQREGMSTSLLARWTGFGTVGAAILGLVISASLVGWFGFQNEVFAQGLHAMPGLSGVPLWLLAVVGGLVVTLVVVFGLRWMNWVAYVAVPAFLVLVTWTFLDALRGHSVGELMSSQPVGAPISLATGTTIVAGGFIAGAIFTPDMSRFNRSPMDVVKQTVVGVTLGEFYVGVIGVLLAHTIKQVSATSAGEIIYLLQGGAGLLGVIVLCLSVIKVNDWNLYPSSLGLTNAIHGLTGLRINRVWVAIGLGVVGSIISALAISQHFTEFLGYLGMLFPPIAAIMIADYFVLRTHRRVLDESRAAGLALPETAPMVVPAGLLAWALGGLIAWYMSEHPDFLTAINVPSIVSLVVAFVAYIVLGKAGLARGIGEVRTHPER